MLFTSPGLAASVAAEAPPATPPEVSASPPSTWANISASAGTDSRRFFSSDWSIWETSGSDSEMFSLDSSVTPVSSQAPGLLLHLSQPITLCLS